MARTPKDKVEKQTRYQKLLGELDEIPCQVNWITFLMGDHPPDVMEDVIDGDDDRLFKALELDPPTEDADDSEMSYRERQEETWEHLKWMRLGWAVAQASTPVKKKRSADKDSYCFFSWGYTHYSIFAAKTIEELLEKIVKWAKKQEVEIVEKKRNPEKSASRAAK